MADAGQTTAYLGLGSNVGDRLAALRDAARRLGAERGVNILRVAPVYETEPVGKTDQPSFLNTVAEARTTLSAHALLETALRVESEMGRVRTIRWGPRVIDIDLLLYGDEQVRDPQLMVPHPLLHERAFVLVPLADLAPDLRPPGADETVGQMLRRTAHQVVAPYRAASRPSGG